MNEIVTESKQIRELTIEHRYLSIVFVSIAILFQVKLAVPLQRCLLLVQYHWIR